jgi:hypothetical protein
MYIVLHVSYDLQEVEPCPHLFFFFMCLCRYSLEVYTWLGVNTQSDSISHLKFILFMMTMAGRNLQKVKSLIWLVTTTLCIWNMRHNIIFNSDVDDMENTLPDIVDLISLHS